MTARLQDYLTRAAQRRPEAGALVMGAQRWTYAELETTTNRYARMLREMGCADGGRVCVLAAKSPATVASLVAVLKAGGVYVPVDSASPPERVARIVTAARPAVLLIDASGVAMADALVRAGAVDPRRTRIGSVDGPLVGEVVATTFDRSVAAGFAPTAPESAGTELAHLLFTSGSTGVPKGVMITHANVRAFVEWAVAHFGIRATDRLSGHPPLHFDLSTFDIYGAFAAGAELHLVPPAAGVNPRALTAFIRDSALTQWFSVPSVLTYLTTFGAVSHGDFPALERLLWCGEVLPTPVLAHWMDRLPHVRFTNLYGPTEATIASSHHTVTQRPTDQTVPIPIGVACAGEELHVLDEDLRPTPAGEIGALFISGAGLSPGYWRDPETTAAAFRTDLDGRRIYRTGDLARRDEDGLAHFVGRTDSQIKSRGYRIELGEIEAAVHASAGIGECAVVGVDSGGFDGTAICCAYTTADGADISPRELRTVIATRVPGYMLPTRWERLDALPRNVNGKIDRGALRERFREAAARPRVGA